MTTPEQYIDDIVQAMRYIYDDDNAYVRVIYMSGNGWGVDCNGWHPNLENSTLAGLHNKVRSWQYEIKKKRGHAHDD